MTKILIVADDLTGALDSAVAFAERGRRTLVLRQARDVPAALADRPDVLALATGTRERSQGEAIHVVEEMVAPLARWADIVFKKVDSRLKGHVAAEAELVGRLTGRNRMLVAPAIPEFGRMVRHGQLRGHGIAQPVDIAKLLDGSSLDFDIPNVEQASDFALPLSGAGPETLLVGARGLAAALAERLAGQVRPTALPLTRPLLIAIGSRDPITLAQVEAIDGFPGIQVVTAPNGTVPPTAPRADITLAQMTPGPEPVGSANATKTFAAGLASLVETMAPAAIFASGGETAESLLAELGVGILRVSGELLPGIPVSEFHRDGRNVSLITKSGGFGPPDTLKMLLGKMGR